MVYKRFTLQVLIRIVLLLLALMLLAFIFRDNRLFFVQLIVGILIIVQVAELIYYVTLTNRELSKLLLAIKHHDFSINFPKGKLDRSFEGLYDAFTLIIKAYQEVKVEREAQFQYMRMIVRHIDFGIIAYNQSADSGEIVLMNKHACTILQVNVVKYWRILAQRLPDFTAAVHDLPSEETRIHSLAGHQQQESFQLLLRKSSVTLLGTTYCIVTFKNIRSEIEQTEAAAWHKLIRVLTHEIMNTVTPITSLTETMQAFVEQPDGTPKPAADLTDEQVEDMQLSLKMIYERSQGIMHFVDDYRKLTRLPKPREEMIPVNELIQGIARLMGPEIEKAAIHLNISIQHQANLLADRHLIEQVLINLLTNAVQALYQTPQPQVNLVVQIQEQQLCIIITDNGPGIAQNKREKVFIPFYTTKAQGSGIGLSLSRQIMALHKGELLLLDAQGPGAAFMLRFRESHTYP